MTHHIWRDLRFQGSRNAAAELHEPNKGKKPMTEITRVFTRLLGGLALVVGVLLWTEAWSVGTYGTYGARRSE